MIVLRNGTREQELTLEEFEARVRSGRIGPDTLVRFDAVTGEDFVPAGRLELYTSLRDEGALTWRGQFQRGAAPVATAILAGLQIRFYVQPLLGPLDNKLLLFAPHVLEDGQSWRLLTMSLLHGDIVHIGGNLLFFVYTSWNIERAMGAVNLTTIYLLSVMGGSLFSMFGSPETRSIGASGGVFGLIAFSVVFGLLRQDLLPKRGRRLFGLALLPYLVVMFGSGLMDDLTDNWCHFGGLVTGAATALLFDPEPLQRRLHWNRGLRIGSVVGMVGVLLGLSWFGPYLSPLHSQREARMWRSGGAPWNAPPSQVPEHGLHYDVPAGWRPGSDAAGKIGFAGPDGHRHYGAWEDEHPMPLTTTELAADWHSLVQERVPEALIDDPVPTLIDGRDGLRMRAFVPKDEHGPDRVLLWRGTTRGLWSVEDAWQVPAALESRLVPLRDRVWERLRWHDPRDLVQAREDVSLLPNSHSARMDLARALIDVGETSEAREVLEALRKDRPEDRKVVTEWLRLHRLFPTAGDPLQVAEQVLADAPHPATVVEVVLLLEALGRQATARGLLDLAWANRPGDRHLRSARRTRDMATRLDDRLVPWDLGHDWISWKPVPVDLPEALDLDAAAAAGEARTRRRQALADALVERSNAGDPVALRHAVVLKEGAPPEDLAGALQVIADDAEAGAPWIPAAANASSLARWAREIPPEDVLAEVDSTISER